MTAVSPSRISRPARGPTEDPAWVKAVVVTAVVVFVALMLVASFAILLVINLLQRWSEQRTGKL